MHYLYPIDIFHLILRKKINEEIKNILMKIIIHNTMFKKVESKTFYLKYSDEFFCVKLPGGRLESYQFLVFNPEGIDPTFHILSPYFFVFFLNLLIDFFFFQIYVYYVNSHQMMTF